ncbi:hypothetical protein EDC01DRAFT_784042 [Geopyxis carbonaria]|nr:hypothetical protein EDC01DRAFT_784042 [Geopyxis carbonaria]
MSVSTTAVRPFDSRRTPAAHPGPEQGRTRAPAAAAALHTRWLAGEPRIMNWWRDSERRLRWARDSGEKSSRENGGRPAELVRSISAGVSSHKAGGFRQGMAHAAGPRPGAGWWERPILLLLPQEQARFSTGRKSGARTPLTTLAALHKHKHKHEGASFHAGYQDQDGSAFCPPPPPPPPSLPVVHPPIPTARPTSTAGAS